MTQADLDAGTVTNHATATGTPAGGTPHPADRHRDRQRHPEPGPDHRQELDHELGHVGRPGRPVQLPRHQHRQRHPDRASPSPTTTPTAPRSARSTTLAPGDLDDLHRGPHRDPGRPRRRRQPRPTRHRHAPTRAPPAPTRSTIPTTQSPALTIDKTITSGDPYTAVGGTITYSYTVTNTGNVTISAVTVTDDNVDAAAGLRRDHPGPGRVDHLHRGPHRDPGRPRRRHGHQPRHGRPAPPAGGTLDPADRHRDRPRDPEPER